MPNAGIHGTRSTNWNSAETGSKYHQRSSVRAKAPIEMASESQRTIALRLPSRFGISRSSTAPASGTSQERVRTGVNSQLPIPNSQGPTRWELGVGGWESASSPQVVPQHDNHADEE